MDTDHKGSHFLFAAALVVQSNEFASLHKNPSYGETYQQALSIMTYCAKTDPQASRLVYIMTTFHNVIVSRAPASSSLRDPSSIPNTPSGGTLVSTPDPMANFFLSHSTPTTTAAAPQHAPTSAPAPPASSSSSTFDPALSMHPHPHPSHHHQQAPGLHRRDSANAANANPTTCGPSPSPGIMPSALTPTTSSTGGDPLGMDAEWFHFDTLWENWAATPQPPPPTTTTQQQQQQQGPGTPAQHQQLADPSLFGDPALGGFDVSGPGGGGAGGPGGSAFATPPLPGGVQQGGGGMNVPLYPMIRFAE